jgi:hypothetical protein
LHLQNTAYRLDAWGKAAPMRGLIHRPCHLICPTMPTSSHCRSTCWGRLRNANRSPRPTAWLLLTRETGLQPEKLQGATTSRYAHVDEANASRFHKGRGAHRSRERKTSHGSQTCVLNTMTRFLFFATANGSSPRISTPDEPSRPRISCQQ